MTVATLLSLFFYIATLALALTWYGADLMNLRWLALSFVLLTSAFCWAFSRQGKLYQREKNDNMLVLVYLILTFMSVIVAENALFSGLRWVSHGMVIFTLLVLLKNSLTTEHAARILLFLKAVIFTLLLVSWLKPLMPGVKVGPDLVVYAGAFGSSNALGQVAAVGAVLYLHGCLTDKARWMRLAQGGMSCLAVWLMWAAGSRSALMAFLTSLVLMYYFYPRLVHGKVVLVVLLVTALMIAFSWVPGKIQQVVLRSSNPVQNVSEQLLVTRKSVWEASWAGFQKRPLLGWGFGATSGIPKDWKVELKALGTIQRDAINDTLFVLEGTGVVGLVAYALLVVFTLRQMPTKKERRLLGRIHSPPFRFGAFDFSIYHLHAVAFILAVSLLLMVQFDNTALSAGNFVSVTLWLCVTLAGTACSKVRGVELLNQRRKQPARRPLFRSQMSPDAANPWISSGQVRG